MLGFINIDKDSGVSSALVVNKIKKALKVKCGHMGTLDPLASGVLPIALGQATRMFDILLEKEKTYLADFDFSYTTPSLDLETEPSQRSPFIPSLAEIQSVIADMTGEIDQIPPKYSAKSVDGSRSYKLARRGVEVELPPKRITVRSIRVTDTLSEGKYRFEIICSSGTYIRSIVRDIAEKLGVCGVMTNLIRTASGKFTIENSVSLAEFLAAENKQKFISSPQDAVDYPEISLSALSAKRLLDGLYDEFDFSDGTYKVFCEGSFLGIGCVESRLLKMKAYIRDL